MATYSDNQIILEIDVQYNKAIDNIHNYREQIKELMDMQAEYQQKVKDGDQISEEEARAYERREVQVRNLKTEMRQFQKEMDNNFKQERAIQEQREGSLVSLRAELSNVTREYDELSKAERDAAEGKGADLKARINAITNELKEAEAATTRYYRNVGNYENAIQNALGANSKWFQSLNMIKDVTAGGLKNALTTATSAVSAFGKQLLSLLANPIVAILAAIAAAIMLVVKGIQSSEQNTQAMNAILAPFKRLLSAVLNVIQNIVTAILAWVQNGAKLVGWIMTMMEKLPIIGKYLKIINGEIRESIKIAQTDADLARQRRQNEVQDAKDQLEIAKLRKKAAEEAKKDRKQQAEDLKRIDDLERGMAKRRADYAKADYENARKKAAQTQNSAQENDELASKEAAMYQAQAEYYTRTTKTASQLATAEKELGRDMATTGNTATDAAQKIAEAKKKEVEAVRSAEDALTKLIKDNIERRRVEIDLEYSRRIEDLETRLEEEKKTLTENAAEAIKVEIETTKKLWKQEQDKWNDERIQTLIEQEQKRLGYLLEAAKESVLKRREIQIDQLDYEQVLEEQRINREITNEQKREEMLEALRSAYNAKRKAVEAQFDQDIENERKQRIENEFAQLIEAAGNNELEALRLQAEQRLQILEGARQLEGESLEQFNARKLQMQKDYNDALKAVADKEVAIEEAKYRAIGTAAKSMSDLLAELGENEKSAAIASKVLALAEIAINSGVAIAKGIKESQSVPFPANIAAIATTVATILSGITSAIKTVKSAKFAQGGTVFGIGTGTSDSINARLSNGESVMTSQATSLFSPILSAMNQLGGGVPIIAQTPQTQLGEDMIAAAVAKGMQMAPRPVVSVEEINNVQQRVEVIENIAKL
jgi:predicted  nucleic acid-binding Zn-ribbon protein